MLKKGKKKCKPPTAQNKNLCEELGGHCVKGAAKCPVFGYTYVPEMCNARRPKNSCHGCCVPQIVEGSPTKSPTRFGLTPLKPTKSPTRFGIVIPTKSPTRFNFPDFPIGPVVPTKQPTWLPPDFPKLPGQGQRG